MQVTVRVPIEVADAAVRTRTVLVVSEDPAWLAVVQFVLGQEGYRVLTARHAGHALVESMRSGGRVDLLLTHGREGERRADFSPRIFADNPGARLLHLSPRPRTREELLAAIAATLR